MEGAIRLRTVPLPARALPAIREQMDRVRRVHAEDLAAGYAGVFLPRQLEKKYKNGANAECGVRNSRSKPPQSHLIANILTIRAQEPEQPRPEISVRASTPEGLLHSWARLNLIHVCEPVRRFRISISSS